MFAIIIKRVKKTYAQIYRRRCNPDMANIKSSAKRDLKSKELRAKNRADKTELKTKIKKFEAAVVLGNKELATDAYKTAIKAIDSAAGKNLLHKNNAANKKSKLTKKFNEM